MTLVLHILMWIGIVLAGMFVVAFFVATLFAIGGVVFRVFDRLFGDRWMSRPPAVFREPDVSNVFCCHEDSPVW